MRRFRTMIDGIAEARINPDAAAQADAEFEDFIAEVHAEAEGSADGSYGGSA